MSLLVATTLSFSLDALAAPTTDNIKTTSLTLNEVTYHNVEFVERDVVIVGAGASGTYAAINKIDSGNSVAVIDNKNRMGGHTETYTDPKTGKTDDYGVVLYHNIDLVKKYAARLNVTLAPAITPSGSPVYADFRTGTVNSTFSIANFTTGMMLYTAQLQKYPYVETGFDLPNPVPEDLLLPFGDFSIKYQLGEEFLGFMFTFAQGIGDLLSKPTLYVFKLFGLSIIENLSTGFLTTAARDNSLIYKAAQAIIGDDNVFLSSKIIAVNRNDFGVTVLIQNPSGYKVIYAKKLIFTIPPKIDNLSGWDLSTSEKALFSQFKNSGYYIGVFGNTGLPTGSSVNNIANDTLHGFPPLPAAYTITPTAIPDVFNLFYGSETSLPDDQVRTAMFEELNRLKITNKTATTPELLAYTRHTPFELWVPASAIEQGFYSKLYSLQGQKSTFYTGAAFHTHDSSMLWQFTEALMSNVTACLCESLEE